MSSVLAEDSEGRRRDSTGASIVDDALKCQQFRRLRRLFRRSAHHRRNCCRFIAASTRGEFNGNLQLAEHPSTPPDDGFNPHGIAVRPELNLMVTSDFICPTTTSGTMPGELDLRGSIRVRDLNHRTILRTIKIPNAGGTTDVRLIPGDRYARGDTAGMLDDQLYMIDPAEEACGFEHVQVPGGCLPGVIEDCRKRSTCLGRAGR